MAKKKPKATPTIDGIVGAGQVPMAGAGTPTDQEMVTALESFRQEANLERKGGLNPRDDKWNENLDLYWGRYDFSEKAQWQSKEKMPEVPSFVDRFAAALSEALATNPDGFYTVSDPGETENDLAENIKLMTDVWLSTCGRNQNGHCLDFQSVFEEQIKLGALTACCSTVTWKEDVDGGRVAIETVDPRLVWLDSTYRNLYRVRRMEVDKHDLAAMAEAKDSDGKPIYKLPALEQLVMGLDGQERTDRETLTGIPTENTANQSSRQPVVLDEYIATILGPDGKVIKKRGLYVVANQEHLIRGPEDNPFWHGKDWLVHAPLVVTPLSVYGRTYMEDFGAIARTFNELTNLLLDAVFTSSMNVFALVPSLLEDPSQVNSGIYPNKTFLLQDGVDPKMFANTLSMGGINSEGLQVWQALKSELREASGLSEVGTGQFAPNSRTSAKEIDAVQKASGAVVRSIANGIETRWLNPVLDLTWKTGLQHMAKNDPVLTAAVGPEMYGALYGRRKELCERPVTFQARGISSLIERSRQLKALLQILQIVGSNEQLLAAFLQRADVGKLVGYLIELSGVSMNRLELTQREQMIKSLTQQQTAALGGAGRGGAQGTEQTQGEALGGAGPGGGAQREMASLVSEMGVGPGG